MASINNEEFQEEDIWGYNNNNNDDIVSEKNKISSKFITNPRRLIIPTSTKMMNIPKSKNKNSNQEFKIVQHSAPVKIPDWSKIYGSKLKKEINNFDNNDDDEEEENVMPPHEWLAKRIDRREISSFSVCEGVGRTLKGRDLSRVRNAVLTKTGFLE
uniref:Senescence regulator n=1 Tax=Solanum lycopersicum TaxID=4081 RepID=A0A3Q7IB48_SOLLC